jgi:Tol biopolymer transport system component
MVTGRKDLAFVWNGASGDNWDIYIKRSAVEQPLRFTSDARTDLSPVWSREGSRIAFARQTASGALEVMVKQYPDGPERKVGAARSCSMWAPHSEKLLEWHPDDKHLIVAGALPGAHCGLSVVDTTTGNAMSLTKPPLASAMDIAPAISSDGSVLAFMRGSTWPNFAVYTVGLSEHLKVIGAPGRLTRGETGEMWPAWIPQSREVVFTSVSSASAGPLFRVPAFRSVTQPTRIAGHDAKAYQAAISVDGSIAYATGPPYKTAIEKLEISRRARTSVAPSTYMQQMPEYSPDGKLIAFESERSGHREIWVSSIDGSQLRPLTQFAGPAVQSPRWSQDGSRIAFTVAERDVRQVYTIDLHGGPARQLTRRNADHVVGGWSTDGKWIYASCNRSGDYQIWRLSLSGGDGTQLTQNGGFSPRLSPDGRYVYYVVRGQQTSLWRIPAAGGREVRLADDLYFPIGIDAVDEGAYYVGQPNTAVRPPEFPIRFVDGNTGSRRNIATVPGPLGWGLSIAPDRQSLLYVRNIPGTFDLVVVRPAR